MSLCCSPYFMLLGNWRHCWCIHTRPCHEHRKKRWGGVPLARLRCLSMQWIRTVHFERVPRRKRGHHFAALHTSCCSKLKSLMVHLHPSMPWTLKEAIYWVLSFLPSAVTKLCDCSFHTAGWISLLFMYYTILVAPATELTSSIVCWMASSALWVLVLNICFLISILTDFVPYIEHMASISCHFHVRLPVFIPKAL